MHCGARSWLVFFFRQNVGNPGRLLFDYNGSDNKNKRAACRYRHFPLGVVSTPHPTLQLLPNFPPIHYFLPRRFWQVFFLTLAFAFILRFTFFVFLTFYPKRFGSIEIFPFFGGKAKIIVPEKDKKRHVTLRTLPSPSQIMNSLRTDRFQRDGATECALYCQWLKWLLLREGSRCAVLPSNTESRNYV